MKNFLNTNGYHVYIILFTLLYIFYFKNLPFLGDFVQLSSQQAHFFFDKSSLDFLLNDEIDSGHVPGMGFILSVLWHILGRELWVGHMLILVSTIGIILQLHKLLKTLLPDYVFLGLSLLLLDTTFLGQSSQVSPDLLVAFFFLLTLNGVLKQKSLLIAIGSVGLCFFSTRGAIYDFVLLIFYLIIFLNKTKKEDLIAFATGLSVFISYQLYHFFSKGWILYHENSPWVECFSKVDGFGFVRNIFVLVWRMCDNGRLATMFAFVFAFWGFRKKIFKNQIMILFIICFMIIVSPLLIHKNLLGHRYLLILFWLVDIIVLSWVSNLNIIEKYKVCLISFLILIQLSGNFWVYPDKIAQGWDASLAYLPYVNLQVKAENFLKTHNINKNEVVSETPFCKSGYFTYLNQDTTCFVKANGNLKRKYVLYSNLINTFSDEIIDSLRNKKIYQPIFVERFLQVKMLVYQKRLK
jgi:hypothetical protein